MKNNPIYASFERMWQHFLVKLSTKAGQYASRTEPINAVDGDFWIDTSVDTYSQKVIIESPTEPTNAQDGDMWIDTSDLT